MPKLHQIVALAEGKKSRSKAAVTKAHHILQKGTGDNSPFQGLERTYQPAAEGGEVLPPESKRVQIRVKDAINDAKAALVDVWDCLLTQDVGNTTAKADIVVDFLKLATDVPVTHLMYLEKQVTDLATFVEKLPTLDPAYAWEFSPEADCYAAPPTRTTKTKKTPAKFVKAEATDKHPAQVEVFHEDVTIGHWTTRLFNGCIPAKEKNDMMVRVRKLQEAIKVARSKANEIDVTEQKAAATMLDFVFGVQS